MATEEQEVVDEQEFVEAPKGQSPDVERIPADDLVEEEERVPEVDQVAETEGTEEAGDPRGAEDSDETDEEQSSPPVRAPALPILSVVGQATEKTGDVVWGKPGRKTGMEDMFAVPEMDDKDIYIADLFETDEQTVDLDTDLSDLTNVSMEDVMGPSPKPKPPTRYRRTTKPYDHDRPTSVGGVG